MRIARAGGLAACWALSALLAACSDVTLKQVQAGPPPPRDDKIAVEGRFCTDPPKPLEFPLRVLFIVDTSQSMNVTDPAPPTCTAMMCFPRRGEAVLEVLNAYPGGNGVEYALEQFGSSSAILTQDAMMQDGFTADSDLVKTRLPSLSMGASETNYEGALRTGYRILLRDMMKLDTTARSRARYVVIFLSDGLPAPVRDGFNTPELIRAEVKRIKSLEKDQRLAEVKVHTVYLAGPNTPLATQLQAKELLADMARDGTGTFRAFEPNERVSFFYLDFRAFVRVFALKDLVVDNHNARLSAGKMAVDSDGDGLLDSEEVEPGTDPTKADTDGDGFSDLLEVRLRNAGFDPLFPGDADCRLPDQDRGDDDGDGLRNCEERFLGTNSRLVDSDADGLPDAVEFRLGGNPVASDGLTDADFDGAANGLELRGHTDPTHDDTAQFSKTAYRYDVREAFDTTTPPGQLCYDFTVENITLVPVRNAAVIAEEMGMPVTGGEPAGANTIYLHMASAPRDSPEDYGNHRVACVRGVFRGPENGRAFDLKLPANGRIKLLASDFKKPAGQPGDDPMDVFDPARDCRGP